MVIRCWIRDSLNWPCSPTSLQNFVARVCWTIWKIRNNPVFSNKMAKSTKHNAYYKAFGFVYRMEDLSEDGGMIHHLEKMLEDLKTGLTKW